MEKYIIYKGTRYWACGSGKYYYKDKMVKGKRIKTALHRQIWEDVNGKIPEGGVIHHKDHNNFNNSIENLEMIEDSKAHQAEHMNKRWANEEYRKKTLEHMDKIRVLASAWHGSKEGLACHSRIGKESWRNRKKFDRKCVECGSSFQAFLRIAKFCSRKCGQRRAWKKGVYNTDERKCLLCKNVFMTNRHRKAVYCGKSCSMKHKFMLKRSNKFI